MQWSSDGICLASLGNDKKIDFWAQEEQNDFIIKYEEDIEGISDF